MKINLENLGLIDTIHTSNMVLFSDDKIKRYDTPEHIINEFCIKRLELYKIRRLGEIEKLKYELKILLNKLRFLTEINLPDNHKDKLIIKDVEDEDLFREMDKRGYYRKLSKKENKEKDEKEKKENSKEEDNEEEYEDTENTEEVGGNFSYLFNIKIRGITKKKIDKLNKRRERKRNKI